MTKIDGNDYEVRNNATNNVKSVHWSVLHRVYDRRRSQSSGAGRGTTDAEDVTIIVSGQELSLKALGVIK